MKLFTSTAGRLRILSYLEGFSLLALLFIGMPLKYIYDQADFNTYAGSIHGALFLLFVIGTFSLSIEENWKFKNTTWKVLLACMVPFGTFYIDRKILLPIYEKQTSKKTPALADE